MKFIYLSFTTIATVVVDYGWSDKNMELYDIGAQLSNKDTDLEDFKSLFITEQNLDLITNRFLQIVRGEDIIIV